MSSYDNVLALLEKRYDHYSARVVLGQAIEAAGIPSDKKGFEPDEIKALASAVASLGTHVEPVVAALNELAEKTAGATKPGPEPPAADEPPAEDAKPKTTQKSRSKKKK